MPHGRRARDRVAEALALYCYDGRGRASVSSIRKRLLQLLEEGDVKEEKYTHLGQYSTCIQSTPLGPTEGTRQPPTLEALDVNQTVVFHGRIF